ncbi:hypothetical protein CAEBREN_14797 [Caenorhabditis brenneri]|uniref:Uncharacterized protein n=1 Tax=Caenorhabditis brenneri TaxID=135651 RepID=G0N445_CAEBE|nr:hypothetical protein CAEBREN_14797 [Caenorhabditis brenneri]
MSLSKTQTPASQLFRFVFFARRNASTSSIPAPARVQLKKPAGEQGHLQYSRNWSRDPRFVKVAIQKGDTPYQFLVRRLGHAYEVYPLFFLTAAWFALFCSATYWSFGKAEIWLDRSHSTAPWDWERLRDNYWKLPTVAFDLDGRTRKRCEIMEQLQDEMLEAAKKRGTR